MNVNRKSETAQEAYSARIEAALGKLDKIKAHIENNRVDGSEVHWGHVGDLGRINELLDEITGFAGNR